MDAELDTLATALYVRIDDLVKSDPRLSRWRPVVGICPKLSGADLLTVVVIQALLGFTSERWFLRYARAHLCSAFPYLPDQAGYNKRLRLASVQMKVLIFLLAQETDLFYDDVFVVDSTPVECGRSRPTAQRSELAGYGYCASHSRFFWGLRLHLLCTPSGLPVAFALANPKTDEREGLRDLLEIDPAQLRPGQVIIADKGYTSAELDGFLAEHGIELLRPAKANEAPRPGAAFLKPLRQLIESVNDTLKGQLDLERHGGRTRGGVIARVCQRLLAYVATIWFNRQTGQLITRSLVAYDH